MSDLNSISASVKLSLVADSGYSANYSNRISPNQWGDIIRVAEGSLTSERIAELEAEVARLKADKWRIDWLADPVNHIGNVSLPVAIVEKNLSSLRDAIDEAMKGGAK